MSETNRENEPISLSDPALLRSAAFIGGQWRMPDACSVITVTNPATGAISVEKVTVSVDHRVIDGVMAATFLKYFKEALETPALLIV